MSTETMIEDTARDCAKAMAAKLEAALQNAITEKLGEMPELSTLEGRVQKITHITDPQKKEHYFLDGDLLLVVYPIETFSDAATLTAKQRIERP